MSDTVQLFRDWSGSQQFAKFVGALQTHCRRKGELAFWQEGMWERFCNEQQLDLPRDYEGVAQIFASVAEVGTEVTVDLPPSLQAGAARELLKQALLSWADRRCEAHLSLAAELILTATPDRHGSLGALVQNLLSTDAALRSRFDRAIISVSIRSPGGTPPFTGLSIAVDTSTDGGLVSLGWGIASRPTKKPWWRLW